MANPKLALIPSAYRAGTLYSPLPTNGDGDFTFARNSVATRVSKDGLIEDVAIDTPRLDYSDGGCPSLLLEPQRTNLITKSNALDDNSVFVGFNNGTTGISTQNEIGLDGQLSAWTFEKVLPSGNTYISIPTNNEHTLSFFAKKQANRGIRPLVNTTNDTVYISLETGVAYGGSLIGNTTVDEFNSEWWRISITATATSARWFFYLTDGLSTGSVIGSVVVQNFQIEEGSYATSYIPTNGSITTRASELCNNAGTADTFNDSEGVLFVEAKFPNTSSTANRYITINDGGGSPYTNQISLYFLSNTTIFAYIGGVSTATQAFRVDNVDVQDSVFKIAFQYKNGDNKLFFNGVEYSQQGAFVDSNLSGLNQLDLTLTDLYDFSANMKIKDLRYYDTVLTDTELTALTTL